MAQHWDALFPTMYAVTDRDVRNMFKTLHDAWLDTADKENAKRAFQRLMLSSIADVLYKVAGYANVTYADVVDGGLQSHLLSRQLRAAATRFMPPYSREYITGHTMEDWLVAYAARNFSWR